MASVVASSLREAAEESQSGDSSRSHLHRADGGAPARNAGDELGLGRQIGPTAAATARDVMQPVHHDECFVRYGARETHRHVEELLVPLGTDLQWGGREGGAGPGRMGRDGALWSVRWI